MNIERLVTLTLIILAASVSRLIPHPYNFTPVAAIALFAGATFERKSLAFIVPLLAVLLSDAVIGFYEPLQMLATYSGFIAVTCVGFLVRNNHKILPLAAATVSGAVIFFVITNCSLWVEPSLYPKNFDGLVQGYVAGIPFFQNTLLSDIFYSVLLFGSFAFAERRFTGLQLRHTATA